MKKFFILPLLGIISVAALLYSCNDPEDYKAQMKFSLTMNAVPHENPEKPRHSIQFNSGKVAEVSNHVSFDGKSKWLTFLFQSIKTPTEKIDSTYFPSKFIFSIDTNAVGEYVFGTKHFKSLSLVHDIYCMNYYSGDVNPGTGNVYVQSDGFVRLEYKIYRNHGKFTITKISDHTISGNITADLYLYSKNNTAIDLSGKDTLFSAMQFSFEDVPMVGGSSSVQ